MFVYILLIAFCLWVVFAFLLGVWDVWDGPYAKRPIHTWKTPFECLAVGLSYSVVAALQTFPVWLFIDIVNRAPKG